MLSGKIALVTGGSRGLGREIALTMARQGADVAIVYNASDAAAQQVQQEIEAMGRRCCIYKCDVADFDAAKTLTDTVISEMGGVDILVNNAGIVRDGLLLSMKEEDFDRVLNVNLKGAFNLTKSLYRHLMKRSGARIINISSVVGLMGNAGQANYAAAKAGLIGFTKSVARELAARGVTCNAIAPGFIETDMTGALSDKVREGIAGQIPMKRMGAPADVAALAAFLASPAAGYITGEVIRVDGGMAM